MSIPVPLSGFLTSQRFPSRPEFAALLRAATVPGFLSPSESSLHRNRASLSGPLAPLQLSTEHERQDTRGLVTPGFPDARTKARLPGSPRDYGISFRRPKVHFPSSLDLEHLSCLSNRHHLLRSFFPPVNPFAPAECFHPLEADPLLDFFLFRACSPQTSSSLTRSAKTEPVLDSAATQDHEDLEDFDVAI